MRLRRFIQDPRANVAPIFAIAIIPVVGFVGAAVDYSRANAVRTSMQAALDSTALALSKDAPSLTQSQLNQKAGEYFNAMFKHPEAKNLVLTPTFTSPQAGSFRLRLVSAATVDTTFTRVLGQQKIDVGSSAEVSWGIKRLEVALALDNTGSMAQSGKMPALKSAVHNLLDTLKKAAKKPDDVKVAIIPFDTTVNIGTTYKNENWIDYGVEDIKKKKWEGCVQDRDQPYDVQDTTPTPDNTSTLFPAEDCGSLTRAMPLSNDWNALNDKVDQMDPNGATNVTIGLAWAWHALTANQPLTEASAPQPDLDKVIIALTDGDNTQNRWSTSQSKIDARTAAVCANIKAAGIKLYTVRVIDGNATLLKNCATNPGMFYDVAQASQLTGVFTAIAQNLANLRISK
jgi:Mg-chelatase subunit ChlD